MPGDYSRISDQPHKRFSALFMQQGRVQLDSDWNESVEILRRRIREEANDIFGSAAVPRATTPNAFQLAWSTTGTPNPDITVGSGRLYVDGLLAEIFPDETISYAHQPYLTSPPALSGFTGNILVYLDVWEREVTPIEDLSIVDPALNGVDTGTRLQTVWQVKIFQQPAGGPTGCVSDFSSMFPPSGARLSTQTLPATQAPNPCELAASGGYQGVDNRLYRVQVHDPVNHLIKWSRDNGSVATQVTAIANAATTSTITVASIGRDDDLSFHVNDWVEVIDDLHELQPELFATGQSGIMAQVTKVDASLRQLTLDRSLASGSFDTTKNVRVRRWDQTQGLYSAGGVNTGLIQFTPGTWITLEEGIQVKVDLPSGTPLLGDAWVFAARVATGTVDPLASAPPIAIRHHYASLGTFTGVGGTTTPGFGDCRVLWPPTSTGNDCACTVCVDAADHNSGKATIQQAVNQVIAAGGGVVCLGPGTFNITATVNVANAQGLTIHGMGFETVLASTVQNAINVTGGLFVQITDLTLDCTPSALSEKVTIVSAIVASNTSYLTVARTFILVSPTQTRPGFPWGVGIGLSGSVAFSTIKENNILASTAGVLALGTSSDATATDLATVLQSGQLVLAGLRIENNNLLTGPFGIAIAGEVGASGLAIRDNFIIAEISAIAFSGVATTPISIDGNVLSAGLAAGTNVPVAKVVLLECEDFDLTDNVITGFQSPVQAGSSAIYVGTPPSEGQVRGSIEENQISQFVGGVAITVDTDVSRLTIRDNSISQADSGIVMTSTTTADDLVVEGNEITQIGATSTTTTLPNGFAGIVILGTTRALVRNNTLSSIGSANTSGTTVIGIGISKPQAASIVENEISHLGPTSTNVALTYGIVVVGPFGDARIVGNRVQGAPQPIGAKQTLIYRAIQVMNPFRAFYPIVSTIAASTAAVSAVGTTVAASPTPATAASTATTATPVTVTTTAATPDTTTTTTASVASVTTATPVLFQLASATDSTAVGSTTAAQKALASFVGDLSLTVTPDALVAASTDQQGLEISGNVVDVSPSASALVLADVVGSCVFRGNRVSLPTAVSSTNPSRPPAGTNVTTPVYVNAPALVVSDNYVNGYSTVPGMSLWATRYTILGNISTTGINLEGSPLPTTSVWYPLNG